MIMKRLVALLLTVIFVSSFFMGCSKESQQKEKLQSNNSSNVVIKEEEDQVNLKLVLWDLTNTTYIQPILDAYKKKRPNVNIEIIDIPANEYQDKLSIMLAGGDDSDVISVKDIPGYSAMLVKNQIDPLDEYIEKEQFDLEQYSGITDELLVNGNLYALPFRSDFWVLYYNKGLFDAAKVPYPSNDMTWNEYEELATKISSGSGADRIYGALHHTWRSTVQLATVQDGKNTVIAEDYIFMKPIYEMILRMQKNQTIMDYASLKAGNIHYSGVFFNEQVAMVPMGTWFMGTLISKIKEGETDVDWGIVKFPHPEGVEAGTTAGTLASLAINSQSKNKDDAWDFIKFFAGPEGAKVLAKEGSLPAIRNQEVLDTLANMDGFPKDSVEALETVTVRLELPMHEKVNMIEQILNEEHELILTESVTVDEGLANMTKRVKEVLNQ
ncbi:MAG: sugar ABC transporter substrate-binding protein [Epulopiscium sp.]|nr:sugar ABC transporter substrate-binding protein [Candidatus Epulonipiscium sp.]